MGIVPWRDKTRALAGTLRTSRSRARPQETSYAHRGTQPRLWGDPPV